MWRQLTAFSMCIALGVICSCACAAEPLVDGRIQPLADESCIVEARVAAVDVKHTESLVYPGFVYETLLARMKISHVYCGRTELHGTEFVEKTMKEPEMFAHGRGVGPPELKVGETGLWFLIRGQDGRLYNALLPRLGGHAWPVRKGMSPRYDEAIQLAQALGKVASAPTRAAQLQLTQEYATSRTPGVSMWAIESLGGSPFRFGRWTAEETLPFLNGLIEDDRVPVAGQVALDNELLEYRKAEWQNSAERLRMLNRWVSARLSADEADEILSQFSILAQHPDEVGFEIDQTLALIKTAVENDAIPLESRVRALGIIGWMPIQHRRYDDDRPAFEFLVDVVRNAKPPELRRRAATIVGTFLPTDTQWRFAVLSELRRTSNDVQLTKALETSLKSLESRKPATRRDSD